MKNKPDILFYIDTMKKHTCKKVFISSTCFDLKDLRAELAISLKEWGYTPIWNESPDFPKKPGLHSHDQCLDVVENCDIYLLIIDNRYGGLYAGERYPKEDISITWYEAKVAFKGKKEMYIYVRNEVWIERATYKKNLALNIYELTVDEEHPSFKLCMYENLNIKFLVRGCPHLPYKKLDNDAILKLVSKYKDKYAVNNFGQIKEK